MDNKIQLIRNGQMKKIFICSQSIAVYYFTCVYHCHTYPLSTLIAAFTLIIITILSDGTAKDCHIRT